MSNQVRRRDHALLDIPRWTSLLGVTATVISGSEGAPLVVLTTMAGGIVYPLDDHAGAQAPLAQESPVQAAQPTHLYVH
jgi:hypothetical protein